MKNAAIILVLIFSAIKSHAQKDVLVLKNGQVIEHTKVTVTPTDITYIIYAHHTPRITHRLPKSEVYSIRFKDGNTIMITEDKQNDVPVNKEQRSYTKEAATSNNDMLYLHNGTTVEGSVIRVAEFTVTYKYKGENAEQVISKYAVSKIIYNSGRSEKVTDQIRVNSKLDWENVVIIEDVTHIAGLTKVGEVSGNTKWFSQHSANGAQKKAIKKLKMDAAQNGCQFIFMTSESDPHYSSSTNYNAIRRGIGYRY